MGKQGRCQLTNKYCVSLDEHHVIPRECGGENGPTILLSPEVHQILHRCINNPIMKSAFFDSLPLGQQPKALALIKAIKYSKQLKGDKSLESLRFPEGCFFRESVL